MIYYDRMDSSEGIDINKTSASKECDIFHYWYFLDKGFKLERFNRNGCHDVLIMSIGFNDIAILSINGADSHYIINGISEKDALNLLKNADLTNKETCLGILKLKNTNFSNTKVQFQLMI